MVTSSYVPDRGHLVWVSFDPSMGREQAGRRPALVLSPAVYNGRVSLALACPITLRRKGYPFEVLLPAGLPIAGAILADHVKSLDWEARQASFAGVVPDSVLAAVRQRLGPLLGFP